MSTLIYTELPASNDCVCVAEWFKHFGISTGLPDVIMNWHLCEGKLLSVCYSISVGGENVKCGYCVEYNV